MRSSIARWYYAACAVGCVPAAVINAAHGAWLVAAWGFPLGAFCAWSAVRHHRNVRACRPGASTESGVRS